MEMTVLEQCRVSPPPGAVAESFLPLTFFDIIWLVFNPISRVLFYDYPYSKTEFSENIVPNLKTSLSLALKYFYPLAGNLIIPASGVSDSNPQIRYLDGDSVSLTFAESTSLDYNHLSGNHARDVDELFHLIPQLPPATLGGDGEMVNPILAIQVTLFPSHGITVGFKNSHVAADGNTVLSFIRAWSSISKDLCSGDGNKASTLLEGSVCFPLPIFDRSVVKDAKGLNALFRSQVGGILKMIQQSMEKDGKSADPHDSVPSTSPDTKKVQATFIINGTDAQKLKKLVSAHFPELTHVSSFTVICAYIWTSTVKARTAVAGEDEQTEIFACAMDCRGDRFDPPIPATYFGNCVICSTPQVVKTSLLVKEDGLVTAAKLIGDAIYTQLHNEEGPLKGAETWVPTMVQPGTTPPLGVAGSPKLDYYNIDFGWGTPKKFEFVSEKFSLSRCKNSDGMEIGLCLPKNEMDVFSAIFAKGF